MWVELPSGGEVQVEIPNFCGPGDRFEIPVPGSRRPAALAARSASFSAAPKSAVQMAARASKSGLAPVADEAPVVDEAPGDELDEVPLESAAHFPDHSRFLAVDVVRHRSPCYPLEMSASQRPPTTVYRQDRDARL